MTVSPAGWMRLIVARLEVSGMPTSDGLAAHYQHNQVAAVLLYVLCFHSN